jgi:hypothetical protein
LDFPDFTDRVIDFIEDEYQQGKLTPEQVERLEDLFGSSESSRATTLNMPIHQDAVAENGSGPMTPNAIRLHTGQRP